MGRRLSRDAVAQRLSTHARTAAHACPSLIDKSIHPHALRHSCAMSLLRAGVDTTVIALWLGHAGVRSTDAYVHADMTIKEKALALTAPVAARPVATSPPTRSSPSSTACDVDRTGCEVNPLDAIALSPPTATC
ncbi:hypothetical protein BGM09_05330 [Streptomyces sp. CBMA29]|nr:hypothetical protein [Streptomyces sp. CBMA29]